MSNNMLYMVARKPRNDQTQPTEFDYTTASQYPKVADLCIERDGTEPEYIHFPMPYYPGRQ